MKKRAAQLDREIKAALDTPILAKDWPADARSCVADAARWYSNEIRQPYAVPDVLLGQAVSDALTELERLDRYGELNQTSKWYDRYETGQVDDEIRRAIVAWSTAARQRSPRM
jgi:hypothetical protein